MPRYQVTLDGKTFVVEGDRPPTEAEARAALGAHSATTQATEPASAPAAEQPSAAGMLRNAGKDIVDTLGGLPDAVAQVARHPIDSVTAIPTEMVRRIVGIAKDPLGAAYEHPVNSLLDIAGVGALGRGVSAVTGAPRQIRNARLMSRVDRYMPNRSSAAHANPVDAANAADAITSGVDRYLPNRGASSHAGDPGAIATARVPPSVFDRYLANQSGYTAGDAPGIPIEMPSYLQTKQQQAASAAATEAKPVARPDLAAPAPTEMPRSWHAFLNDDARQAASASERQRLSALHREVQQMDADYRRRIADERGSVPLGMFLTPSVIKDGATMAIKALGAQVPKWAPSPRTVIRGGRDAALIAREAPPQPDALASLVALLSGGGS